MSAYAGIFAGYPTAFINANFSFLSESSHFLFPANILAKYTYLRVCFPFDKGGTGNLKEQTFRRFPEDRSSFFTLLAALLSMYRWTSCNLDPSLISSTIVRRK